MIGMGIPDPDRFNCYCEIVIGSKNSGLSFQLCPCPNKPHKIHEVFLLLFFNLFTSYIKINLDCAHTIIPHTLRERETGTTMKIKVEKIKSTIKS